MKTRLNKLISIVATASMLLVIPTLASAFRDNNGGTGTGLLNGSGDSFSTLGIGGNATSGAGGISSADQQIINIAVLNASNNSANQTSNPTVGSGLINNNGSGGLTQSSGNGSSSQTAVIGGNTAIGATYSIGNNVQLTTTNIISGNNNTMGGSAIETKK